MKRIFTLLMGLCLIASVSSAQLADGTKLTTNITGTDHLGNEFDLFAELDAGKSVIIDVFAAWCGPCWTYHESGLLKDLYAQYGPEGTDQLVVLGLEAEGTNTAAQLTGTSVNQARSGLTLGDWTEGVLYPIIDDASYNTALQIGFFPTLYLVRPDRTVLLNQAFRYNIPYYETILFNDNEGDLLFEDAITETTFCDDVRRRVRVPVRNIGTQPLVTGTIDLYINGEVAATETIEDVAPLTKKTVDFGNITIDETSVFEAVVNMVNGVPDPNEFGNSTGEAVSFKVVSTPNFTMNFTTDFYPVETSWELQLDGEVIESDSYSGPANGGGPDANQTFMYGIELEDINDFECLQLVINDAFGDGLSGFNSSLPTPGVELLNDNGDQVKPLLTSDWSFENSTTIRVGIDPMSVGVTEVAGLSNLNVFPNPVSDQLTLSANFDNEEDIRISITDQLGRIVSDQGLYNQVNSLNESIDVSNLNTGLYVIRIATDAGASHIKFIKQ